MTEREPAWEKKPDRRCRTCRYWDKPLGKRAISGMVYPCSAPVPELKELPESITRYFDIAALVHNRKYMERDEGQTCPVWARSPLKDPPSKQEAGQ